jgi:hypothetical protein
VTGVRSYGVVGEGGRERHRWGGGGLWKALWKGAQESNKGVKKDGGERNKGRTEETVK